jgi:hypothetical protein
MKKNISRRNITQKFARLVQRKLNQKVGTQKNLENSFLTPT